MTDFSLKGPNIFLELKFIRSSCMVNTSQMHSAVNFYHTSEIGEERSVLIKKEQVNLAQLA